MKQERHSLLGTGFFVSLTLCALVVAGCSKPEEATDSSTAPPPGKAREGAGGPGGMSDGGRRGGGPGKPVSATASGAEIYQAKCGCHGPEGKGGKAPNLTAVRSRSDVELYKIIHDGRQKMPAFGAQLTEEQIKKVVAYLKQLPSGK